MSTAMASLRHLYANMINGAVRDTASAKRIAEGLLAPAIEQLESARPPEALLKAGHSTDINRHMLLIEFRNLDELHRGYDELVALLGQVIPTETVDMQKTQRLRQAIASLSAHLKSGGVWDEYCERLTRGL